MTEGTQTNFHKQFESDFENEFLGRMKKSTDAGLFTWTKQPEVMMLSTQHHIEVSMFAAFEQDITKSVALSLFFSELASFLSSYDLDVTELYEEFKAQHAANMSAFGGETVTYAEGEDELDDEDEDDVEKDVDESLDNEIFSEGEDDEEDGDELYAMARMNGFRTAREVTFVLTIIFFVDNDDTVEMD